MKIQRPIKDLLQPRLGESALASAWEGVRQRRDGRRRAQRLALAFGGLSLALALLLVWVGRSPPPLRLANDDVVGIMEAPRQLRTLQMNDGSQILLSPGARLDTVANEKGVFGTTLVRGRAEFEVRPGSHRRWLVHAGDVTVEVVGTHFVVNRDPASVWVHVTRGEVIVRGERVAGGVRHLVVGDSLSVASTAAAPLPAAGDGDEPKAAGGDDEEPAADAPAPVPPVMLPPGPYQIAVQRVSGADPHLPDAVKRALRGKPDVSFVARICVDKKGAVSDVAVLQGIDGANEDLEQTLRRWRYQPQPIPLCFVTQLIFSVQ